MSEQHIFELQFKGLANLKNQYVSTNTTSISDFSKLREFLSECTPEKPFLVQYVDDDDDIVSVDTEEEFKEFSKLVKQRSSKGMLVKLILKSSPPTDQSNYCQPPLDKVTEKTRTVETLQNEADQGAMIPTQNDMTPEDEWKLKMKLELKEEIMSEMKNQLKATRQVYGGEEICYDIDSEGNAVPLENKQRKHQNKSYKKLEKREKFESKIDQRLEMLELKKKKLLEKASLRTAVSRRPFIDSAVGVPFIMSGIATKESSSLPKRVKVGKVFLQVWHVINDGTVAWNNVELRHTWSSPGLEPDELLIKCAPLAPGQEDHITMKFKAPKTVGALTSYWHFFYQVDSTWQQFGHYVSVAGSCKMPKLSVASAAVTMSQESNKKQKSKTGCSRLTTEDEVAPIKSDFNKKSKQGYVQIPTEQEFTKLNGVVEVKVLNGIGLPAAQNSAQLKSAEIAAEMARMAATLQRSVVKPTPAVTTVQTECLAEEIKNQTPCQVENLLYSGSETDLNVDNGEDTDPGFVFVDIPIQSPSAESAVELVNNCAETANETLIHFDIETIGTLERIDEMKKTEMEKNEQELLEVINNEIGKLLNEEENKLFHALEQHKSKDTLKPNPLKFNENDKNGNTLAENTSSAQSHNIPTFPQAGPLPQPSGPTRAQYAELAQARRPMSFPRLDPNVQYPVFPIPVASQPQQPGMYYASHPSPSQPVVFPPPTFTHYAKMGSYHQVPYQMHGSSHPMPWATPSAFHPAMPNPMINPVLGQSHIISPFPPCGAQLIKVPSCNNSAPPFNPRSTSNSNDVVSPPEQAATTQSAFNSPPVGNETAAPVPETTDAASVPRPEPLDQNKRDAPVQILPQALVDGAINVAANAYSTAWNAINTLRPKEGEASEFDPVFENNMAMLAEMGFNNLERNARLLKRFNNDVSQVIGVICSTGGGNLEID